MIDRRQTPSMKHGSSDDLGFDPQQLDGEGLALHLEARIQQTLQDALASNVWRVLSDPATDLALIRDILKEVYLEISMYQPDSIEAAIASIGQFPRSMPLALIEEMLHHQVEEFDHGEMALRDYVSLGGDEGFARTRIQSPSAFAVAAMWRNITHKRDPFLYLGAVYLFDGLTPIATKIVMEMMAARSNAGEGLEFITHHATADLEHTRQIRALIVEVADKYPASKTSIAYGYEYFKHVYPIPVWDAACMRAIHRAGRSKALAAE